MSLFFQDIKWTIGISPWFVKGDELLCTDEEALKLFDSEIAENKWLEMSIDELDTVNAEDKRARVNYLTRRFLVCEGGPLPFLFIWDERSYGSVDDDEPPWDKAAVAHYELPNFSADSTTFARAFILTSKSNFVVKDDGVEVGF